MTINYLGRGALLIFLIGCGLLLLVACWLTVRDSLYGKRFYDICYRKNVGNEQIKDGCACVGDLDGFTDELGCLGCPYFKKNWVKNEDLEKKNGLEEDILR